MLLYKFYDLVIIFISNASKLAKLKIKTFIKAVKNLRQLVRKNRLERLKRALENHQKDIYKHRRMRRERIFAANKAFLNETLMSTIVVSLITIGCIAHFVDDLVYFTTKHLEIAPLLSVMFSALCLISFFMVSFTDPGTIPRSVKHEILKATSQETRPPISVNIRGKLVKLNWCQICGIRRPPRSSHCRQCDRCVMKFDHHCFWVGTCIGIRNYRYFFSFILWFNCLQFWLITVGYIHVADIAKQAAVPLTYDSFVSLMPTATRVVLFLCSITVIPITILVLFHLYLAASDKTTREILHLQVEFMLKGPRGCVSSPYSKGNLFLNFSNNLCGPLLPSLTGRKYIYDKPAPIQYERPDGTIPFKLGEETLIYVNDEDLMDAEKLTDIITVI